MANIYAGNCSFNVTEEQLRDLFATHGDVDKVNVITDRDTGLARRIRFRRDVRCLGSASCHQSG